ncbi:MAG: hypothetical protein ACPGYV_11070, partial [Phycisphaeraceae bacterium]
MTRREMIKASAGAAALASISPLAYAQAGPTLKVGLVGCGGRGTGAANDISRGADGIEITAMAEEFNKDFVDRFPPRVHLALTVVMEHITAILAEYAL